MALRRQFIPPETTAYRLINAEGDGIPGLIVDRYSGFLVISIDTGGCGKMPQRDSGCSLRRGKTVRDL